MKELFFCVITFFCLVAISTTDDDFIDGAASEELANAYQNGWAGFGEQKLAKASEAFLKASKINPGDDLAIYFSAAAFAMNGQKAEAVSSISELSRIKSCLVPKATTFKSISDLEAYQTALKALTANAAALNKSENVFTLAEKDLIPEGIAFDPWEKAFYVSSLYKRKIVKIREDGKTSDFTTEGQDGLYSVLGMKVDVHRRFLWVASSAEAPMKNYDQKLDGFSGLFQYDITNKKLIKKYALGNNPPHLLNDVTIDNQGNVYATDTISGEIFRVKKSDGELETLIPAGKFQSPNGIDISGNGKRLFVSDVSRGIYTVDVPTKTVTRLSHKKGISTAGIDGLYFHGTYLIGVSNVISGGRVLRYDLNPQMTQIVSMVALDCNHPLFNLPTTGAIAGDSFVYIANSQYGSYKEPGVPLAPDQLKEVSILKIKL